MRKTHMPTFTIGRRFELCITIGIEFSSVNLKYNDKNIKLQLWDTAGRMFAPI